MRFTCPAGAGSSNGPTARGVFDGKRPSHLPLRHTKGAKAAPFDEELAG